MRRIPVEKVKIFEVIRRALFKERITHRASSAVEMLEIAEEARNPLDPRGPWDSLVLIRAERISGILVLRQGVAKTDGVFQGLTAALGDVLQHRMRGIPEQGDPSTRPRRNRQTIEHRPSAITPHETNSSAHDGT